MCLGERVIERGKMARKERRVLCSWILRYMCMSVNASGTLIERTITGTVIKSPGIAGWSLSPLLRRLFFINPLFATEITNSFLDGLGTSLIFVDGELLFVAIMVYICRFFYWFVYLVWSVSGTIEIIRGACTVWWSIVWKLVRLRHLNVCPNVRDFRVFFFSVFDDCFFCGIFIDLGYILGI